jgi:deoxyribonucleoside regulator
MNRHSELELLLEAARLYYEDSLTQQEVGEALGVSRPTVSRLLAQARQEGIVQIKVVDPLATHDEMEARLEEVFSLRKVLIVAGDGVPGDRLEGRLGLAAARYLHAVLEDGALVGIGWGRTLHAVAEALESAGSRAGSRSGRVGERQIGIQVFPLIGGLGQLSPSLQVNELARRLADAFGGTWRPLFAPAFVDDDVATQSLVQVPDVAEIIETWPRLDVALVGIGHFAMHRQSSMLFGNYLDEALLNELEQRGAVGDLCGRFLDGRGQQCLVEPGVIGISLKQLKTMNHVVGVAGGEKKARAILGVLRGGYLDVLVTDTTAARAMLQATENHG